MENDDVAIDVNNRISKNIENQSNKKDIIILSRHTFYKLAIIAIIGLMAAAFFGGYSLHSIMYPTSSSNFTPVPDETNVPTPFTVENITIGSAASLGSPDASILVVEFGDFQCSFCSRFASTTFSEIKKEYIDTGKIRFVYKHYPFDFHQNSRLASVASECAKEQGKFWEYHDILMSNQTEWETLNGNHAAQTLVTYSENLGLDSNEFKLCLDSMKFAGLVDMDLQQGIGMGVTATPSFFVGTENNFTLMEGSQPFSSFKRMIDSLL